MGASIRFPVTLDGIRDTRQLQQRRTVAIAAVCLGLIGGTLYLLGSSGGVVLIAFGALLVLLWRFPVLDAWFDRRRLIVGSACEVWLDDSGLWWRQAREGTFDTSGHVDWSRITQIMENSSAMVVMGGRAALVGIPKKHVESPEQLAAFRDEVRRRITEGRRRASKPV